MPEPVAGPDGAPRSVSPSAELLRRLPLFADLPDEDIGVLCRASERVDVAAGELLIEEGAEGDGLYVVLEGELEVSKREAGEDLVLARRGVGEFLGEMSLLERVPRSASVRALDDAQLLFVGPAAFQELLTRSPSAAATLLRTVANRLRSTEATLMQREKLASLGILAAGLAHELNNPAAAIGRAAGHLQRAFDDWRARAAEVRALPLGPETMALLAELEASVERTSAPSGGALATSQREEELAEWLEDRGVGEGWVLAPPLVGAGWTRERTRELSDRLSDGTLAPVVQWLASGLEARSLLVEIQTSARAISDIVRAVKTYTYLDQAPVQEVDVRAGLDDTLSMLKHKLKAGVEVEKDYDEDLPLIEAFASELNQVWTNLVDNAVDAMEGAGTLTLSARPVDDQVEVRIEDDGPGIPPDVARRVFDPFFTTKEPGLGSGLGLHIAYNIVVHKHGGRLTFESQPGRTVFTVVLPTRLKKRESEQPA